MVNTPPFWLAALALLLVMVFTAEFPRAGSALLGVIMLMLLLNAKRKGVI